MQAGRDAEKDLAMCDAATVGAWEVTQLTEREIYVTVGYEMSPDGKHKADWIAQLDDGDDDKDSDQMMADAEFIAKAREALPYWIKRAVDAEEKLKWVSRDDAEMHDDWIESSARATAAATEIERLQYVAESLYQIIQRGGLTSSDMAEAERIYVGT